jgi:hypothetical protein
MLYMSNAVSVTFDAPLVASPKQAMIAIQVSRKKLYELINPKANRDASRSNQSTTTSSADWQQRPFGAAALHPTEMINHVRKRDPPVGDPAGRGGDQKGNIPASSDLLAPTFRTP